MVEDNSGFMEVISLWREDTAVAIWSNNKRFELIYNEKRLLKALAERSQHIITSCPNFVGPTFTCPGQTIATLLGATCRRLLATLLQRVATCWVLKMSLVRMPGYNIVARTWPNDHNIMQHPQMLHEKFDNFQIWANNTQHVTTTRSMSQQGDQTRAPCCAQQCCNMLC